MARAQESLVGIMAQSYRFHMILLIHGYPKVLIDGPVLRFSKLPTSPSSPRLGLGPYATEQRPKLVRSSTVHRDA